MKLMPALPESIFDLFYLVFMIRAGLRLLNKRRDFGVMCLVLGCGDAFHLIPRVLNYWLPGDFTAALGVGKLVTSITMTVFYVLLERARQARYGSNTAARVAVWALSAIRIVLCCFPQNGWTSANPSLTWGILRNIPFAALGILTVALWLRTGEGPLRPMWLAVALSFVFYLPVVLWAQAAPMVGMLMLPKTCMYIWMAVMFTREAQTGPDRENPRPQG